MIDDIITAADCAADFRLFGEYYDTSATITEDAFNAQPYAARWLEIAECFADNSRGTCDETRADAELKAARSAMCSSAMNICKHP